MFSFNFCFCACGIKSAQLQTASDVVKIFIPQLSSGVKRKFFVFNAKTGFTTPGMAFKHVV
jgi:hypothetical protein